VEVRKRLSFAQQRPAAVEHQVVSVAEQLADLGARTPAVLRQQAVVGYQAAVAELLADLGARTPAVLRQQAVVGYQAVAARLHLAAAVLGAQNFVEARLLQKRSK
jgi:hypothetical protein